MGVLGCSAPAADSVGAPAAVDASSSVAPGRQPAAGRAAGVDPAVDKAIRDRVNEYWAARVKFNLTDACQFYEPSFRATYSRDEFLANFQRLTRFRPEYRGIEWVRLGEDGKSATIGVRLRTRPEVLQGEVLDSVSEETWFLIDDVWYRQSEVVVPTI